MRHAFMHCSEGRHATSAWPAGWRLAVLLWLTLSMSLAQAASPTVSVLHIDGPIGPATADFVNRGIERAQQEQREAVVLEMDTPGGLDLSMRDIVKAILASRVPVVTYVAPSGARAASAGTYILYASHVAAMAPGTNLGAATPVAIGGPEAPSPPVPADRPSTERREDAKGRPGDAKTRARSENEDTTAARDRSSETTMTRKQVHDAAAYIRGLAQLRGRNAEWGERAVREAVSLSGEEALAQHVVDVLARDTPDLLAKIDGRQVVLPDGARTLHTAGAAVVRTDPDARTRFLSVITNPSFALVLLMVGVYGLFFEFLNPGLVLPGVAGAIALLVGLFALQLLPISYAGLGLIVLGLGFMIAEAFVPAFGSLGIGGVVAFTIGALMLVDTDVPGFGVPFALVITLALLTAAFVFGVSAAALRARKRPVVTGGEQIIGSVGVMLEDAEREGWAWVRSERWRVESDVPLRKDQLVRVVRMHGLLLGVTPAGPEVALPSNTTPADPSPQTSP